MQKQVPKLDRQALVAALRERYQVAGRKDKTQILQQFVAVSGYHRKSAIRLLNATGRIDSSVGKRRPSRTIYDEAVRQALQVLWEASDRVCSKRLKALIPTLLPALQRHGHLQLDPQVAGKLLSISAASIDRLLRERRPGRTRPKRAPSAATRQVPIRTFADWGEPEPGYMEMDLVAHCGQSLAGAFVYTLTLTDVASGWTECMPLLVREAALVRQSLHALQIQLPFELRGLDVDNGSEFINDTLVAYCHEQSIEYTRSRPYHKNDQAWVEQKNGSVVRRLVGYGRLQGVAAADALQQLYCASRLFVNFFQPSFKLKEKVRVGARVVKRYHAPLTPCARLLASDAVGEAIKQQLRTMSEQLDPLALLDEIRCAQRRLALIAAGKQPVAAHSGQADLARFMASLDGAWREGEVRPTHQAQPKPPRHWRTRTDPFEAVWPQLQHWLQAEPDQTARALLERLQHVHPQQFGAQHLRTLQRRVKAWRRQMVQHLVFGVADSQRAELPAAETIDA